MPNSMRFGFKKAKKGPSKKSNTSAGVVRLNVLVFSLIALAGLTYLIQINSLITKGYEIQDLKSEISDLKLETDDLELEVLQLKSMSRVKKEVEKLDMVAVTNPEFIQPTPVALAE